MKRDQWWPGKADSEQQQYRAQVDVMRGDSAASDGSRRNPLFILFFCAPGSGDTRCAFLFFFLLVCFF